MLWTMIIVGSCVIHPKFFVASARPSFFDRLRRRFGQKSAKQQFQLGIRLDVHHPHLPSPPSPPPPQGWCITSRGGADQPVPGNNNVNDQNSEQRRKNDDEFKVGTKQAPSSLSRHKPQIRASQGNKAFLGKNRHVGSRSMNLPSKARYLQQRLKQGADSLKEQTSKAGPAALTTFSILYTCEKGGISFATLYALALLGASVGFYLFLYFITIGYSLGITLPLMAALIVYNVSLKHSGSM